jgi:nitrite reductase/ring-hydroxylating ferredoxin subunit
MAEESAKPTGPDFTKGIALASLPEDGMLVGHVGEEEVLLVRSNTDIFALAAHCTHYHGPLVDGLVVDGTVRCPWHHACFDLRSGEALHAPAFEPLTRWKVEQRDDSVFVRERLPKPRPKLRGTSKTPGKIVIAGGWGGRLRCGRNAPSSGLPGSSHHA